MVSSNLIHILVQASRATDPDFLSSLWQTLLEKVKAIYSDLEALSPERIVPTVGLNIGRVDAHKCKLIFWDLGGQVRSDVGALCSGECSVAKPAVMLLSFNGARTSDIPSPEKSFVFSSWHLLFWCFEV